MIHWRRYVRCKWCRSRCLTSGYRCLLRWVLPCLTLGGSTASYSLASQVAKHTSDALSMACVLWHGSVEVWGVQWASQCPLQILYGCRQAYAELSRARLIHFQAQLADAQESYRALLVKGTLVRDPAHLLLACVLNLFPTPLLRAADCFSTPCCPTHWEDASLSRADDSVGSLRVRALLYI